MDQAKTKELAGRVSSVLKATASEVKSIQGIKGWLDAAPRIVKRVEEIGAELKLQGPDKKALAIEIAMNLMPSLSWYIPSWLVRMLLSLAIEQAVRGMNALLEKKEKA